MKKDIESLIRPNIAALCPYSTARDEYKGKLGIFIDANESPYENGYNRYPDPRQASLKQRIGALKGIPVENLFLGNGSDEAIDLIFRIFCRPGIDNFVAIEPSYGMYSVSAHINDIEERSVRLGEGYSLPYEKLIEACDENTKVMFLCSPNNPSGNAFEREDILRIADSFKGILVVDEAYVDFSEKGSLVPDALERGDIIVLQTLSKAWGMAGLRLGMAVSSERIISVMSNVKYPYNINKSGQELAMKILGQPIAERIAEIKAQRGIVAARLAGMPFVEKVYPSDANFLLVKVDDADAVYNHLVSDGIIVRNRNRVPGCKNCLRITIGLEEENKALFESLNKEVYY